MPSLKLALRNIIRIPKRTLINLLLILLVVASITSGVLIFSVTGNALDGLDENYTFVATMVTSEPLEYIKGDTGDWGKELPNYLNVNDFYACFDNADIIAYNVSFRDNIFFIPAERWLFKFPGENEAELDAVSDYYMDCAVYPTNNLYLERGFFEGKFRMKEGGDFSAEAYRGSAYEIIIPEWFAKQYGISVGDKICYCIESTYYKGIKVNGKFKGIVSGIYENVGDIFSREDMSIYIPLQTFLHYGDLVSFKKAAKETRDFVIGRADFVLHNRDSINDFIENAKNNGIDTNKVDIVFNNAEYDMIRKGLVNVRIIVFIVVTVVAAAGVGIIITFTVNTITSREKERQMLHSVGMARKSIALMLLTELFVVLMIALPLGYISGHLVSNAVCRYADGMVEDDRKELELLSKYESDSDDLLLPLNCNIKMSIADGTIAAGGKNIRPYRNSASNGEYTEIRLVTVFDTNVENFQEAKTSEYTEILFAVADDISNFIVEDHVNEYIEAGMYLDGRVLAYVPHSSKYKIGQKLLLMPNRLYSEFKRGRATMSTISGLVCGYCDDSLGLESDMLLISTEEFAKTGQSIFVEMLPHCDMVIPTAAEK